MHTAWYRPCTPGQSRVQIEVAGSVLSGQARLGWVKDKQIQNQPFLYWACFAKNTALHLYPFRVSATPSFCIMVTEPPTWKQQYVPQSKVHMVHSTRINTVWQYLAIRTPADSVACGSSHITTECSMLAVVPHRNVLEFFLHRICCIPVFVFAGPFQHQTCQPRLSTECRGPHAFLRDLGFKRHEMAHDRAICRFSPGTCDHAN